MGVSVYDVPADVITVLWDFGDGESATGAFVEHTYEAAGDYDVRVCAIDDDNGVTCQSLVVTIKESSSPSSPRFGLPNISLFITAFCLFAIASLRREKY